MKKILFHSLAALGCAGLLTLASCSGKNNTFATASGSPGEIMLVMDGDWLKSTPGEEMKGMLQTEVPSLPQIEPWMRVQTVAQKDFGDFLRNTRNIIIVQADEEIYSHNSVKFRYDEWAKGQLVIILQTPSKDSLQSMADNHGEMIRNLLLRHELYRYAEFWSESFSSKADGYCREVFGYHINLPEDILSYKKGENFLWLSNNAPSKRTDIAIYTFPYSGKEDLSKEKLIARRDSVLGRNIPGATPDSKMTTTSNSVVQRTMRLPTGKTMIELRGLWETDGSSAMAGPFVAHAFAAPEEGKVYYIEGFVYHPNENKRELIRRIQASLFSFRPQEIDFFDPEPIKNIWWSQEN